MGPRAGLGTVEERKTLPLPEIEPWLSIPCLVAIPIEISKVGSSSYDAYKGKFATRERCCHEDEDLCLEKLRCLDRNIFLCPFVRITVYQELFTESPAYIACLS
jgi:hypothetical protein